MSDPVATYDAELRRKHLAFLRTIFPETPLTVEESEHIAANLPDDKPPLSPERIAEIVAYATGTNGTQESHQ